MLIQFSRTNYSGIRGPTGQNAQRSYMEQKQALNVQEALGDPRIKVGSCSCKFVAVV